jgi:Polyketide cyclase / dehydrase and lipid transport
LGHIKQTTPMDFIEVEGHATSRAAPAAVFWLLKNSDTWPRWSMFKSAELEQPGQDEPYGVGSIRVFSTSVTRAREQVVELIAERQLSYVLLSGLPFRNYRADVRLTSPGGSGTHIDWTASFQCRYGTGWFWRLFMNRILSDLAKQLAVAAEKNSAG